MLESLLSLVLVYTYPLIFIVGFFASVGIPLPATALFLAGGAFVGSGYLSGYMLFLVSWGACVLGDITAYSLAFYYGRGAWERFGLQRWISLEKIERKYRSDMEKRGFFLIFTSRFLFTAIGPTVNILAGFMKIDRKTFFTADILGEFLYVAITLSLGYSFANEWQTILSLFESASVFLTSSFLLGWIFYIFWKHRSRFLRS